MILTIGVVGSFCSILGLIYMFIKEKRKIREWILLVFLIIFVVITCIQYSQISKFNSVKYEANKLINDWPSKNEIEVIDVADLRGIWLAGYSFLERNKEIFPDSFEQVKNLMQDDLDITSNDSGASQSIERNNIEEATRVIMQIINDIGGRKYPRY